MGDIVRRRSVASEGLEYAGVSLRIWGVGGAKHLRGNRVEFDFVSEGETAGGGIDGGVSSDKQVPLGADPYGYGLFNGENALLQDPGLCLKGRRH